MIGDRNRDRHVDADHADLDAVGEGARRIAVAREDRGAVAVFVRVDEIGRFIVVRGANDGEHRPEDLFSIDRHVARDAIEQRAAEEEAVLVTLKRQPAAVDDELGTFRHAFVDEGPSMRRLLPR